MANKLLNEEKLPPQKHINVMLGIGEQALEASVDSKWRMTTWKALHPKQPDERETAHWIWVEGSLDEIIQALITHDQAEKLKNEAVAA